MRIKNYKIAFTNLTEYDGSKGPKSHSPTQLAFEDFLSSDADILAIDYRVKYSCQQPFANTLRKLLPRYYEI